jgi:single-stranded-DNA-specific exonuclease
MELGEEEDGALISVDAELPLSYLTPDIFTIVDRFEPYGEGNAPLVFLARGLTVAEISIVGKEAQHVKLSLEAGKHKWPAVYWQAADKVKRDFDIGDKVDAVFEAARNFYKGSESPQLVLKDLARSGV